jgi:hypothetical protein
MAIKTYTEQLESVQTAIEKIEGGSQSYSIDNVNYSRADLDTLYKREERLLKKVNKQSNGGITVRDVSML